MELIDPHEVQAKLQQVTAAYEQNPNELNTVRLGIIYHETALNLSFLTQSRFKGYAQKSFDVLSRLFEAPDTTPELMPFIASFRASALSLVGAETRKLKYIGQAFALFEAAIRKYAAVSYLPEYLRGSVAENLPWYFFSKRKLARRDFQSIIDKEAKDPAYANWKIMSFTYWAWARQHTGKKDRARALAYLDKAIQMDPHYQAGRARAEQLKKKLAK